MIRSRIRPIYRSGEEVGDSRNMELRQANVEGVVIRRIDVPMRWTEHGEGLPVVLIHGLPTSLSLWRAVVPRLVGVRSLAWEMVGYGASTSEGNHDISASAQADYLALWLKHLGISRAVLAGHGVGGAVAQIAVIRYPGICAGLVLAAAMSYGAPPIKAVRSLQVLGGSARHLPQPLFRIIFRSLLRRGHDSRDKAEAALEEHWPHYARSGATAFVRQVRAMRVRDTIEVAERLPFLNVPARVVWGTADSLQRIEHGERLAADLRAPLRRIAGAGHFTPEDHPDIVAEEINLLVETVQNSRRPFMVPK